MPFSWIPFYKELAENLLEYKERRKDLVDFIYAENGLKEFSNALHLEDKNQRIDDIDPFSVFGLFNSGNKRNETRIAILEKMKQYFKISAELPSDFDGIPVLIYSRSFFYDWQNLHNLHKSCDNLWECYEQFISNQSAKEYIESQDIQSRPAESTMPLFWIKPFEYIALDSNNREYLKDKGFNADNINTYEEYMSFLNKLKHELNSNVINEKTFVDLSYNAWRLGKDDTNYWVFAPGENAWDWDSQKREGIFAIGWGELGDLTSYKNDKDSFLYDFKDVFKDGDKDKTKSANEVWDFYKQIKIGDIVFARSGLSKIIGMGTVTSDYYYDSNRKYFPNVRRVDWQKIGDWNYPRRFNRPAVYNIKKREQVKEILKIMNEQKNEKTISLVNLLKVNKNLILHGAPGTGKTYTAKDIAAQMICNKPFCEIPGSEDEKLFYEQTEFVQFHPSYDYSDFVEGLRPITGEKTGDVGFDRKPGVFMKFCEDALENYLKQEQLNKDRINLFLSRAITKEESFSTLRGNEFLVTGYDDKHVSVSYKTKGAVDLRNVRIKYSDLLTLYEQGKDIDRTEVKIITGREVERQEDSYSTVLINKLRETANKDDDKIVFGNDINREKKYIFIIDEINRGEMSKIFGELFFSIDPDYRGQDGKVRTQYANMLKIPNAFDKALGITDSYGNFFVPKNVYIIGTMNDIDRSVDSMDFAMRRRFTFVELKANECLGMLDNAKLPEGITQSEILEKMKVLNEEIEKTPGLSSSYHIGGSYFAKLKNYCNKSKKDAFECLWNNHLRPLITDYMRGLPKLEDKLKELKEKYDNAGLKSEESDK